MGTQMNSVADILKTANRRIDSGRPDMAIALLEKFYKQGIEEFKTFRGTIGTTKEQFQEGLQTIKSRIEELKNAQ